MTSIRIKLYVFVKASKESVNLGQLDGCEAILEMWPPLTHHIEQINLGCYNEAVERYKTKM